MDESILTTIKKLIGLAPEDTSFDTDLTLHINSVLMILNQLGVSGNKDFILEDETNLWSDYLPEETDSEVFKMIRSYIAMKVRLVFDPPQNGTVMDALKSSIAEYEWRLNVQVDPEEESGE